MPHLGSLRPLLLTLPLALALSCGGGSGEEMCPDGDVECVCGMDPSDPRCAECDDPAGCDPCEEDPTAPGCDACEMDPDLPQCMTCEDDISLPGCDFEEPSFAGPSGEVEILRDGLGIPHVYADDDADAMFGSGYAQARDRLFQMELTKRRALGRRAEWLGEGFADDDALVRHVNLEGLARLNAQHVRDNDAELFELALAWKAGVNRRVEEVLAGEAPLPYGYDALGVMPQRWTLVDAFAVARLLLFGNGNQIEFDILTTVFREFLPELHASVPITQPMTDAFIVPPADRPTSREGISGEAPDRTPKPFPPDAAERLREFSERMAPFRSGGSNNWVIAGEHTFNGRPLIANDPHQPLDSPSLFWIHHMNSADAGGTLDTMGFAFVGAPLVQLGHNRDVAWAATTHFADNADIWSVAVDGDTVTVGDETAPILRTTEEIPIADAEPMQIDVEIVPGYGVLLPDSLLPLPSLIPNDRRMLLGWTGFRRTNEFEVFMAFDRAETAEDVTDAADGFHIGSFNFMAADASSISYRSGMLVPDRGDPSSDSFTVANQILDGDDPNTFWNDGMLPSALLPHSSGAERGWIASANNAPFGFTGDGDLTNDPFYIGSFHDPGTRGRRIHDEIERLVARGDVTVDDMKALQTDTHQVFADRLIPLLDEAWTAAETEPELSEYRDRADVQRLVTLLRDEWDRKMERDAAAAVAFELFAFHAAVRVLEDDLTFLFDAVLSSSPTTVLGWTTLALEGAYEDADLLQEGRDAILLDALAATADLITERWGGVDPDTHDYTWGDFHGTKFDNPLGDGMLEYGWVPTDGGTGTVNVSGDNPFGDGGVVDRLESGGGAIFRSVTSFADDGTPRTVANFPIGVSGEPDSPLWDHTVEDWVEDVYRPLAFERAEVEADLMDRTTLSP